MIRVLQGVNEESKVYRLYGHISQRIIISRDVMFKENKTWDWDKKDEEAISYDLGYSDCEANIRDLIDNEESSEYVYDAYIKDEHKFSSDSLV